MRLRGDVNVLKTEAEVVQTLILVTHAKPDRAVAKTVSAIEKVAATMLEH